MAAFIEIRDSATRELMDKIERAAFGRIRQLQVRQVQGQLVLEGFANCFHDKQRAQEAVFSVARFIGPISNRIEVKI